MNKILLMFFVVGLILVGAVSATNYYVDNAVATSGNGQSWSTAWKLFSNIQWSQIMSGDTVYVSGGVTQKIYGDEYHTTSSKPYAYTFRITASGTQQNPITITSGKDPGHDGDVIFNNNGSWDGAAILIGGGNHYVIIDGFKIRNYARGIVLKGGTSNSITNIYIQNNDIETRDQAGIFSDGWNSEAKIDTIHDIYIRNNTIYSVTNTTGQTDIIYFQYYYNLKIEDNILRQLNSYNSDDDPYCSSSAPHPNPHADVIQTHIGSNLTVSGNYIEIPVERKCSQIFMTSCDVGYENYYGNIIYSVAPGSASGSKSIIGYYSGCSAPYNLSININFINNILIADHFQALNPSGNMYIIKNNIFYSMRPIGDHQKIVFLGRAPSDMTNIDGNLYYGSDGSAVPELYWIPWGDRPSSWNMLTATGAELHGLQTDPQFTDFNGGIYSLKSISPAIDHGLTLDSKYSVSYNGVSRPQGSAWDIGAYEFVDGATTYHPADLNQNGCIDLGEISVYVSLWLNGSGVTLSQVSDGVNEWMRGC